MGSFTKLCLLLITINLVAADVYTTPPARTKTHVMLGGRKFSLKQIISMIQSDCGEVCNTDIEGPPGKYYPAIEKDFDCDQIMRSPLMELSLNLDKEQIPPMFEQLDESSQKLFTLNGQLEYKFAFMDSAHDVDKANMRTWTEEMVDEQRELFRNGHVTGLYGLEASKEIEQNIRDHMIGQVEGGRVLVIGSYMPWLEAILLELGAKHVVTLEYDELYSEHPQIETWTPEAMRQAWMKEDFKPFDAVASFSSLEHSGLGRYGDALNPWRDLITSAKAWCMTRPGGTMLIGVPTGYDALLFNACRLYGPFLYSHLFANWDQVYTNATMFKNGKDTEKEDWPTDEIYGYQPVHVVAKGERWVGADGRDEL